MTLRTVRVALEGRSYDVLIGPGALDEIGRAAPLCPLGRAPVVADSAVWSRHGTHLSAALERAGLTPIPVEIPSGEATKSFAHYAELMERLLALDLERREAIFAFGGGVTGDLAGFAAATLKRGAPFVQIPTTLLSQVDSSVGGKTGINAARGKNLVGAFHQPGLVLADTDLLATLPAREIRAGYAEIAKIAAARDADFFAWLEANGPDVVALEPEAVTHAVARAVELKAEIVAEDERESGVRALLNFGHTFAHAAEAEAGYGDALRHGEAVGWGLGAASRMAAALGICAEADAQRLEAHLRAVGLPASAAELPGGPYDPAALLDRMRGDKKASMGRLVFVLPRRIGEAYIETTLTPEPVLDFLKQEFPG